MGMVTDQSRIYSSFSMADTDGTYGKFQENDTLAEERGLVRSRKLSLDRQYLYDPQQALVFRRKFAGRGATVYYFDLIGAVEADLGDRITYGSALLDAPVTHIRMTGNQNGVRTRLEAYRTSFIRCNSPVSYADIPAQGTPYGRLFKGNFLEDWFV